MKTCKNNIKLPIYLIESQQKAPKKNRNLRYNAFTAKAYAKNTNIKDIGKPPIALIRKPILYNSQFKRDYLTGHLPFEIDNSIGSNKVIRLAWKQSIQTLDLTDLLPITIHGLADSDEKFADLAELTIIYIFNHAHRRQIYQSLPFLIRPFRFVFRSFNKHAILVGLKSLTTVISSLYYAGRVLIPEYEKIMSPLNAYLWGPVEKLCDDIFYGQWHKSYIVTAIENALRIIEKSANSPLEQYAAYHELKKAIPCYESGTYPIGGGPGLLAVGKSASYDLSKPVLSKENPDEKPKAFNLRLIDVNAM